MTVGPGGTLLLFGASSTPSTSYAWNGDAWIDGPDADFVPFLTPRAAYDAAHDEIVVVNAGADGDETWTSKSGSDLTLACAPPDPCPAPLAHVAYDAVREVVVAISNGGGTGTAADDGTYEWDGAAWTRVADLPVPLVEHELVFHSWRDAVVAFPTRDGGDQWELLADHTWSPVPVLNKPPPRDAPIVGMNEDTGELWSIAGNVAPELDAGDAWRLPMALPPALVFKTVLAAAGRAGAPLTAVRVRAYAGATSFGPVGANLLAWERGRFEVLASNSVRADAIAGAVPFDVTITDPAVLERLPVGNEDAVFVAVSPKSALELAGVTSDVALDAIAVTVDYRLP
jgi:hypothetical protein